MTAVQDRPGSVLVPHYREVAPAQPVLALLERNQGYWWTASDIALGTGNPVRAVVARLNELLAGGRVERIVETDPNDRSDDPRTLPAVWSMAA